MVVFLKAGLTRMARPVLDRKLPHLGDGVVLQVPPRSLPFGLGVGEW
jgi:hypothetical protein